MPTGTCKNNTGEAIGVYGPNTAGGAWHTQIYRLPPGRKTPNEWDCDGIYVPKDRSVTQALGNKDGPLAVKYFDGLTFTINRDGSLYDLPNLLPDLIYTPAESPTTLKWPIPEEEQSWIDSLTDVPNHESI